MNIPSQISTLIAGIIITLISLWYGQNHGLLPVAASSEAGDVDGLFNLMMTISTGLFLLIQGALILIVIKFRRQKNDQTDGPSTHGNIPLEMLWTAIPTVIVFVLAVYSFEVYNAMGGLDPMASHDHHQQEIAHNHEMSPSGQQGNESLIAMAPGQGTVALGIGAPPGQEGQGQPLEVNVAGMQYAWIFTYPETGVMSGEMHVPVGQP
ncbi:MAG: cytochrome c oxidase subunit II, partial [Moorea sp. SIO3G5]|nr:cytochrome c oxidase subunit II [Moorena sp. SIO3G5]